MILAAINQSKTVEVVEITIPISRRMKCVLTHLASISSRSLPQFVIERIMDEITALCIQPEKFVTFIMNHGKYMNDLQCELDEWNGNKHTKGKQASLDRLSSSIKRDDCVKIILPDTFPNLLEVFCPIMKRDIEDILRECLMVQLEIINQEFQDCGLVPTIDLDEERVTMLKGEASLIKQRNMN